MNEYLLGVNAHIQEARSKFVCFDSANSPFDGDTYSPFRPYGESLFVKRDKK
ncbi:hypothetical protein YSA_01847 [Pseudomonas putida ND6]|uniref:Uncharacterized protein n=1 Tax=Pseudomonas putida ND6 TaxID=231023 RepID=I3UQK3_PSEPU|nr:hypothetical protein YSA_01847 [Pseudomonas putida ND6]